jgi:4-amino-4-deoxychorismate lyase
MFPFFESIAIVQGKPRNLFFHQARIERTFKHFFPKDEAHHLEYLLFKQKFVDAPLVKCKFTYNENRFAFYQLKYIPKTFKRFILIRDDHIDYPFKLTERTALDNHLKKIPAEHQYIIIKKNLVTDSSYSNLIFYDGYRWLTPAKPLLAGTMRASLLAEWKIHDEHIESRNLHLFKKFKLINALNSFEDAKEYSINLIDQNIYQP